MVNLYNYSFNLSYTNPISEQESMVQVEMNISKGALDEFTAGSIAGDYIGRHLFSRYNFNMLPNDRKDATILTFNRKSVELRNFKRKLLELDICEYLILLQSKSLKFFKFYTKMKPLQ